MTVAVPPDTSSTVPSASPVAELRGVSCHFTVRLPGRGKATVHAVDDVDLAVARGTTLGLVGESGSGKSTLARVLLRLVPTTAGRVLLGGEDITDVKGARLRALRRKMQLVFQDPYSSFDPLATIGASVGEALSVHTELGRPERDRRVAELLDQVRLPSAFARRHPRQVSGGQLQRAADRAGARHRARDPGTRRATQLIGRHDPGADGRAPGRASGPARHRLSLHIARPEPRPHAERPGGGDVSRPDRGGRTSGPRFTRRPTIRTRKRCCQPHPRWTRDDAGSASCSRATFLPRLTHRAAAASARAAGMPWTYAPRRSRPPTWSTDSLCVATSLIKLGAGKGVEGASERLRQSPAAGCWTTLRNCYRLRGCRVRGGGRLRAGSPMRTRSGGGLGGSVGVVWRAGSN